MSKRLLRSVIDFDPEISSENLTRNFQKLRKAVEVGQLDWGQPVDDAIYKYLVGYFLQHFEMPSGQTVTDYFQSVSNAEALERLKDIQAERAYARTNFVHLLQNLQEEQAKIKAVVLLKETHEILIKGIEDKKTKKIQKGVEDALLHFTKKMQDIRVADVNVQIHGDIRKDGAILKEEYNIAETDKSKVMGVLTGLNEIDEVCKGVKKGELWIHAGFPGELKCVAGDATLYDHATNRRRSIKELYNSRALPIVTALDREGATHKLVKAQASHLIQNGIRDVYNVSLTSGRSVGVSSNHKFLTPLGWKCLNELRTGSLIATPAILKAKPSKLFSDAEVKLVGYLIGDGALQPTTSAFTNSNFEIRQDFKQCLNSMGLKEGRANYSTPTYHERFPKKRAPYIRFSRSRGSKWHKFISPVRQLLDSIGLWDKKAAQKAIPDEFYSLPDNQLALLLGALWSTDGSCHTGKERRTKRATVRHNNISYGSKSEKLCLGIQSLLLRLGIQSTVTLVRTKYKGRPYRFYAVHIVTNQSKRRFCEKIRVIGKDQNFEKLKKHLPSKDDRLFPTESIPERMRVEWDGCHGKRWRSATCTKSRRTARADTLRLFSSAANVKKVLNGDLAWDQIKSIHFRGQEMTYDLAVPVHHSFVVNDILTHNTTFGNNWCYNAVTRFKKNVVYVSFEMTREQLRRSIITIHTANARFAQQGFKALDYRFIRDGLLTKEEKDFYLNHVIADFESNPTYTHYEVITPDRDWTMDDVRIQLEQLHKEFEVGLVVLDHGQWIEARRSRKNKDYTIELNSVVNDSKRLALTFDHNNGIPVVMLFQINRQGKDIADKNEGVYKISALTYSNACEKSADVITATYLNKELRAAGLTKFSCLKNRDNPPFEPFEAHINFMCRKIMSAKRLEPQGFSVTSHDDYLGAIDIAL